MIEVTFDLSFHKKIEHITHECFVFAMKQFIYHKTDIKT